MHLRKDCNPEIDYGKHLIFHWLLQYLHNSRGFTFALETKNIVKFTTTGSKALQENKENINM